ncbi:FtsH-binding integral membrane protein [Krasilnikovia cinnamomea]|uniref:FtsH-binding integral membrane protein n=1 Tax=Krasilnikovia cinnamomea TaxID=349313 RepID=A0A4Q7ZF47_9ACTN|nr:hypothetical protein [Krasilnikovia cinnamomea]RZU49380.1 FtsH-binding integral membrane protein [Krasilnikovia cinnamomea]
MLANALSGYRLALIHGGRLLAAILPPLALSLIGALALDLSMGRDQVVIVDGGLLVGGGADPRWWLKLALAVAAWLLALTAGTVTVVGALRERPVDPLRALAVAVRQFPALALGTCAVGGVAVLATWAVVGVAGAVDHPFGIVLVVAAGAMIALAVARTLLGVATRVFGGSAWELTRGRVLGTAGAFLLGGVVCPVLASTFAYRLATLTASPVLADVLDAVLLTGVVAVQAGILAHVYVRRVEQRSDGADLGALDARLAPLAGGRVGWAWLGLAALALPVVLSTGVAAANPFDAPALRTTGSPGGAVAVAWPAGQHPVIVTDTAVRFCDTDLCDRYIDRDGGPPVVEGWGTAGIGPDGAVVTAAVTGSEDRGGPFIEYGRCTRAGCIRQWLPVRASAREPFGWPELAVSSAPDGAVWFALAMPSPEDRPGRPTYTISLIRCAQVPCAKPERHVVGTTERTPADGFPDGRRGRLSIGADGRPVAAFWIGHSVHVVTCDPVTCANPRATDADAAPPDARWSTPTGLGQDVVSLRHGELRVGGGGVVLAGDVGAQSGAIAVAGSELYATATVATTAVADREPGLRVRVGRPRGPWQQILWRCPRAQCTEPERVPLDLPADPPGREALAVGGDGRVLIVRPDRVLLVTPPPAAG